jgi:hypothetical protein
MIMGDSRLLASQTLSRWSDAPVLVAGTASRMAKERDGRLSSRTDRPGAVSLEAFIVSLSTVTIAEMGDRTQLLALLLATHYRRHWPILAGIFVATLANHAALHRQGRRVLIRAGAALRSPMQAERASSPGVGDRPATARRYFSVRLSAEGAMRVTGPLLPRTTIR